MICKGCVRQSSTLPVGERGGNEPLYPDVHFMQDSQYTDNGQKPEYNKKNVDFVRFNTFDRLFVSDS